VPLNSSLKTYAPPAGKAVEAPWGEAIAESVVQKFTTVATRNSLWTTPPSGAVCTTTTGTDQDKLWYFNGTAWVEIAFKAQVDLMMPKSGGVFHTGDVTFGSTTDRAVDVTFFGRTIIRGAVANNPMVEFWDNGSGTGAGAAKKYGTIKHNGSGFQYTTDVTNEYHSFFVGLSTTAINEHLRVVSNGVRCLGNGAQLSLIDTTSPTTDTLDCYMQFYGKAGASAADPKVRSAYFGFIGTTEFRLYNEESGGALRFITTGAGLISLQAGTTGTVALHAGTTAGDIQFYTLNTFRGMVSGNHFLWGKSKSDSLNAGSELWGTGSGHEGLVMSTNGTAGSTCFYARQISALDKVDQYFYKCYNGAGAIMGGIIRTSGGCDIHKTSDRRLKNIIGPVTDGVERIKRLQPHRVTYIGDPDQVEQDALVADEVQQVMPELVTGEPDAVAPAPTEGDTFALPEGSPVYQGVTYGGFTTVMIAALQEVIARLEALEEEAAA